MGQLEITDQERVDRKEAAARLRALANALARKDDVEYARGGLDFKVQVPEQLDFKLEIELQEDEWELEVELKWGGKRRGRAKRS